MALVAGGEKRKDVLLRYGYRIKTKYKCARVADLYRVIKGGRGLKGRGERPMVRGGVGVGKTQRGFVWLFVMRGVLGLESFLKQPGSNFASFWGIRWYGVLGGEKIMCRTTSS